MGEQSRTAQPLSLRLDAKLVDRLNRATQRRIRVLSQLGLLADTFKGGIPPSRAHTLRWVIEEGLKVVEATLEREEAKAKRGGRR